MSEPKKKTRKKRTTQKKEPKGVGDIVEKVFEKTGVAAVAKFVLGEDCGCEERKQKLNEMFRRSRKPECLQEDEYNWLHEWFSIERNQIKPTEQQALLKIYNRIFNVKQNPTSCASCIREIIEKMRKVYLTYED